MLLWNLKTLLVFKMLFRFEVIVLFFFFFCRYLLFDQVIICLPNRSVP